MCPVTYRVTQTQTRVLKEAAAVGPVEARAVVVAVADGQ